MTLRKILIMDESEGFDVEASDSDSYKAGGLEVSGTIAMGGNKITGADAATEANQTLVFGQQGAQLGDLNLTNGGDIVLSGGGEVTGLPATTNDPTAAVSKAYVDSLTQGLDVHPSVKMVCTSNIASLSGTNFGAQATGSIGIGGPNINTYCWYLDVGYADIKFTLDDGVNPPTTFTAWNCNVGQQAPIVESIYERLVNHYWTAGPRYKINMHYDIWLAVLNAPALDISSFSYNATQTNLTNDHFLAANTPITQSGIGLYNVAGMGGGIDATIDGVQFQAGTRVLLTGQTVASQNGIWVIQDGAWTRPNDFQAGASAAGSFVFIEEGDNYADTGWVCTANVGNDVVDSHNLAWSQFAGAGTYTAGDGLALTGSQFKVDLASDPGLEFLGVDLRVRVNVGGAIERVSAGLGIILEASDPSLQISSNELGAKLDTARAITKGVDGIGVSLETSNPALKVASNKLDAKYQIAKGLDSDVDGLFVKVDGSTVSLTDGDLQVIAAIETERVETSVNVDEAVALGDPVYLTSSGNRIARGDTDDAKAKVIGVARSAQGTVGAPTEVVASGPCVGVLSVATPGVLYYLATGGGLTVAIPGASKRVVVMGIAKNETDLFVHILDYGKRAA